MKKEIRVLDKGFVRLLDTLGGDAGVVNAARVSYAGTSKGEAKDQALIAYLLKHQHLTPFEHAVLKFHVKCPIFVARQWFRHRWASYNEVSYRYTQTAEEFYVPETWRRQDTKNKQGSLRAEGVDQAELTKVYRGALERSFEAYKALLDAGVAREMARMALPVALYTEFYWTINARSINFLSLRADAHAQSEIQAYAEALASFFQETMPWTYAAFLKHLWKGENARFGSEREKLCASSPS